MLAMKGYLFSMKLEIVTVGGTNIAVLNSDKVELCKISASF